MVYIVIRVDWEDRFIVGVYDNMEDAWAHIVMASDVRKMIEVWEIGGGRVSEIYANNIE
jgi:hypothetical protein